MRTIHFAASPVVALIALSSCSSSEPAAVPDPVASASVATPSPSDSPVKVPEGKYTQTWKPRYDETSCKAYQTVMTPHERWVAAADMLSAARASSGINELLPPDPLVDGFAEGIDMVCIANPTFNIALAAAGFYTDDIRFQQ